MTDPALEQAMLIVERCREEGLSARLAGVPRDSCPYSDALERAAWLDGYGVSTDRATEIENVGKEHPHHRPYGVN